MTMEIHKIIYDELFQERYDRLKETNKYTKDEIIKKSKNYADKYVGEYINKLLKIGLENLQKT